jgi:hypothetical protein
VAGDDGRMSPPPRSLTFAVSTSLLTASLSLAGCDEPKKQVNPGPVNEAPKDSGEAPKPEPEDHVNVGPEPTPEPPPPEPIHVNEGPEPPPQPEVAPPDIKVNPGPNVEQPQPEPIEPKRVNTRPDSP